MERWLGGAMTAQRPASAQTAAITARIPQRAAPRARAALAGNVGPGGGLTFQFAIRMRGSGKRSGRTSLQARAVSGPDLEPLPAVRV
jgi:hypothetical protein